MQNVALTLLNENIGIGSGNHAEICGQSETFITSSISGNESAIFERKYSTPVHLAGNLQVFSLYTFPLMIWYSVPLLIEKWVELL